jgi:hypothetical protein
VAFWGPKAAAMHCQPRTTWRSGRGIMVATEAQPAKQTKLLVVEDDVVVRMLLTDMRGQPTSILRSSTPTSKAGPSRRLPMPSSPAT